MTFKFSHNYLGVTVHMMAKQTSLVTTVLLACEQALGKLKEAREPVDILLMLPIHDTR